jgi:hypothetical protein
MLQIKLFSPINPLLPTKIPDCEIEIDFYKLIIKTIENKILDFVLFIETKLVFIVNSFLSAMNK